jgi:hypothetical protein
MDQQPEEQIAEIDRRLLPLRADRLACRFLLEASRGAIRRLEDYAEVTAGNSRVPMLALARLRAIHRDWESAAADLERQMDEELAVWRDTRPVAPPELTAAHGE